MHFFSSIFCTGRVSCKIRIKLSISIGLNTFSHNFKPVHTWWEYCQQHVYKVANAVCTVTWNAFSSCIFVASNSCLIAVISCLNLVFSACDSSHNFKILSRILGGYKQRKDSNYMIDNVDSISYLMLSIINFWIWIFSR